MALIPEDKSIEVSGNTLRASGDLGANEKDAFGKAIQDLMATEQTELVIDISGVPCMTSVYVRDIALVMVWAKQHDRSVRVRATDRVARLLSMGGIEKLGQVDVVQ
ncbi:MAG: STAS domain-containing protein [Planctomycetota bacterium]|jgi:anti-anti-sigma factor